MNKAELIDKVSSTLHIPKRQAEDVITATVNTIMDVVSKGDKVTLVGFGTFEKRDRAAREGRNPKTNEKMSIPASTVPAFSAGKQFKAKVAPAQEAPAPAPAPAPAKAKAKATREKVSA